MKKVMSLTVITVLSLGISGCTSKVGLGHFTAASTHNVRNLNYDAQDNTKILTSGEACIRTILFFKFGAKENRQEIAMNNAIRNGQNNKVDGDMLVNVQITEETSTYPFYHSDCIKVEGDLVRLK